MKLTLTRWRPSQRQRRMRRACRNGPSGCAATEHASCCRLSLLGQAAHVQQSFLPLSLFAHSCKSFHSQSFIHLFACPFPATQPAAPPKPRPPPDVSDRLTLDDRKFTRMCVAGWDARLALRICLALQWLADSAVTKEQGCSGEREGGPYA